MTIEYRFLISDLNLHLPVLESIYCNLFFRVMHWTTSFSPWGIFYSSDLRHKSARTIVKLFGGRMSAFDKLAFLCLEGTRGNQQMKGKLIKHLAQKITSTCTASHGSLTFLVRYLLPHLLTISHSLDDDSWVSCLALWDCCMVLDIVLVLTTDH